jgi:hypothetical protein
MSNHTRGPWTLLDKEAVWWVMPPEGEAVQIIPKPDSTTTEKRSAEEILANAALIAAAPEMLDALEAIANSASSYGERDEWPEISRASLTRGRAAIAKAKGAVT